MEDNLIFTRRLWAEINMNSIRENYEAIRNAIGEGVKLCCVVKADGYGHGAVEICKLYHELGVDFLAVSNLDEALELRRAEIEEPILILGYTPANRCRDLSRQNISQAVYSLDYAKELSHWCEEFSVEVKTHIKLDTGMSRIGFMCQEFPRDNDSIKEIKEACSLPRIIPEGVFTHFAVADTDDDEYTKAQFARFMNQIEELAKRGIHFTKRHICNSAGILRFPGMHLDLVRAGIILYGLMPPGCPKPVTDINLKPVMNWYAKVIHVKTVPVGATVSYGRHFEASRPTEVTTVGIGYADGLSRRLSNGFELVIGGKKCPIIGNICMDMCMVDTTDLETRPKVGDKVTVFGSERSADELADALGTINYEITCDVGKRVRRLYVGG